MYWEKKAGNSGIILQNPQRHFWGLSLAFMSWILPAKFYLFDCRMFTLGQQVEKDWGGTHAYTWYICQCVNVLICISVTRSTSEVQFLKCFVSFIALLKQFQPHTDIINSIELLTRSERLLVLTASSDCSAALWDIEGRHIGVFGQVECISWMLFYDRDHRKPDFIFRTGKWWN